MELHIRNAKVTSSIPVSGTRMHKKAQLSRWAFFRPRFPCRQSFPASVLISCAHRNARQHARFRPHFSSNVIDPAALLVSARSGYPIRYIFCIARGNPTVCNRAVRPSGVLLQNGMRK
jgi:hypothetical protein